jgi:GntR family transcriptional regulator, transcriptional repressor for pyruvate dehydrogenase complex
MAISRSTLRQALTALVQSGHLRATRGRSGGTFVAESPPQPAAPTDELIAGWREAVDARLALESGVALLAAQRATPAALAPLDAVAAELDGLLEDFTAYRPADVRLHIGIAELTGSARLVTEVTAAQGEMTDLIARIPHPPEVLASANAQHARLLAAIRRGDGARAAKVMGEHVQGLEHVLAGLLPSA